MASGHKDAALYQRLRVDLFGVGVGGGYLLVLIIDRPPTPFILIADLLYTYIMQFSICYCGYRS